MLKKSRSSSSRVTKRASTRSTPTRAASSKVASLSIAPTRRSRSSNVVSTSFGRARTSAVTSNPKRRASSVAATRSFTSAFSDEKAPAWNGPQYDSVAIPKLEPFSDADTIIKAVDGYKKSLEIPIEHSPFGGLGKVIKENGKLQFLAFLGIGLASKEIYQIDAGTLNLANTTLVLFTYYIALQGNVRKAYTDYRSDIINRYQDALRAKDALLQAGIQHCEALLGKPAVVQDVNKAYQEAHDALTEANVRRDQQKHKDNIEAKLNALYFAEQTEARAKAEATKNAALDFIRANALSDKVKADVMKEALSLVGVQEGNKGKNFKSLQTLYTEAMKQAK